LGVLLVEAGTGTRCLVRFLVEARHQRGGIGRPAVELLLDELCAARSWHARGERGAR
jgi:hypothetical protein